MTVDVVCTFCGEISQKYPSNITGDNTFCDKNCYHKWRDGKELGKRNGEYKNCETCGKEKWVYQHRLDLVDNYFCDNNCRGEWLKENNTGNNHPRWKGGVERIRYGSNWTRMRNKIRKRDKNVCQRCERGIEDVDYKYDNLPVHHINPVATFEKPENANTEENLVQLCKECHRELEQMNPSEQREEI